MDQQDLIVRRSVRHDVAIRGSVSIASEHSGLIRFGSGAGGREGWVDVDIIDFSSNGLGFMTQVFVPRKSVLLVRVYGPEAGAAVIVETPVRVQRVIMTDRRPGYLIGTSFEKPPPKSVAQINKLLELLSSDIPVPQKTS